MNREKLTLLAAFLAAFAFHPARAQLTVRGDLSHDEPSAPGSTYARRIVLENLGAEPVTARLYQTDYRFAADGTNAFDPPGSHDRSNAAWITFDPSIAVVEPRGTLTVAYQVAVPGSVSGTEPTGTYWSMLMIEGEPGDRLSASPSEGRVGLRQVTRYGVQIATHVGSGTSAIQFANGAIEASDEGPVLTIDLVNTGETLLRPDLDLRLVDGEGHELGPFGAAPRRIYPGTSVRQVIRMTGAPPGEYSAILIADSGGDAVFGASLQLKL